VEDFETLGTLEAVRDRFNTMLTDYQGNKAPDRYFDLLMSKITDIKTFLEGINNPKRLLNTSLLFVFDRGGYNDSFDCPPAVDVKMIDIGHMEKLVPYYNND